MAYEATLESVGDGWSNPRATVRRWNEYIMPVLAEIDESDRGEFGEPVLCTAQFAAEWAWSEFCQREAGEFDDLAEIIAKELREEYLED